MDNSQGYFDALKLSFRFETDGEFITGYAVFFKFTKIYLFYLFSKEDFDFFLDFLENEFIEETNDLRDSLEKTLNEELLGNLPDFSNLEFDMLEGATAVITWGFFMKVKKSDEEDVANCESCPLMPPNDDGEKPN